MKNDYSDGFIPPHGGYAGLLAYQKVLFVFEVTARFCKRFLKRRDRTVLGASATHAEEGLAFHRQLLNREFA